MKARLMIIGSALLASLIGLPAIAQPVADQNMGGMGPGMSGMGPGMSGMGPGMSGMGPGMRRHGPRDCSQVANPEACRAHQAARMQVRAACQGTTGPARRACMQGQMQSFDCAKAGNPQHCEARKKVYQECQGQPAGPAFRQCVQQRMPAADCSKAADPHRCALHEAARAACRDKAGPDHMACLRAQFGVQ